MFKVLARALRKDSTLAERRLWKNLRGRRYAMFRFRRQETIGEYIVDFVCFDAKLIIEADGGQHGENSTKDAKRTSHLESRGYRVLRFWNNEILGNTDAVLEHIYRTLINTPHPNPLPGGEGIGRAGLK
jgi:very-short-patch-repair endonuclease